MDGGRPDLHTRRAKALHRLILLRAKRSFRCRNVPCGTLPTVDQLVVSMHFNYGMQRTAPHAAAVAAPYTDELNWSSYGAPDFLP